MAKDDVRGRIKNHLFGEIDAGWSGISMDIYPKKSRSHRKKIMHTNGKIPFINGEKINSKNKILKLNLSAKEISYVKRSKPPFYFRNGINIFEDKHKRYTFRVYFITNLSSYSYAEIIEKEWRKRYNSPRLCSYKSGR